MTALNLTVQQLSRILPKNKEVAAWHKALVAILPQFQINTVERVAAFLAQCAHESSDFTVLEENLNYSAKRLTQVWPKRFPPSIANQVAGNPRRIAEIAYGNRMGNNQPNDGYLFRGQGIIQLTGRDNFTRWGQSLNLTAEQAVERIKTKQGAVEAAAWFWKTNNLNRWVDTKDFDGLSDSINIGKKTTKIGDAHGYADRLDRYRDYVAILSGRAAAPPTPTPKPVVAPTPVTPPKAPVVGARPLRKGARGKIVEQVQTALGIDADGAFGPKTEEAVTAWQQSQGLDATGHLTREQVIQLLS